MLLRGGVGGSGGNAGRVLVGYFQEVELYAHDELGSSVGAVLDLIDGRYGRCRCRCRGRRLLHLLLHHGLLVHERRRRRRLAFSFFVSCLLAAVRLCRVALGVLRRRHFARDNRWTTAAAAAAALDALVAAIESSVAHCWCCCSCSCLDVSIIAGVCGLLLARRKTPLFLTTATC